MSGLRPFTGSGLGGSRRCGLQKAQEVSASTYRTQRLKSRSSIRPRDPKTLSPESWGFEVRGSDRPSVEARKLEHH